MNSSKHTPKTGSTGRHLVVVGCGGNIGSHLVPNLDRMPEVGRLTLIDPDIYSESNLVSQNITPYDVGRPKAIVQRDRVRERAPDLDVTTLVAKVEDVPWGLLRGDVILSGLDSRRARQAVNERARHLGIPWIDAGVEADAVLARISCYGPGEDQPCLECSWSTEDYDLIEQAYSCDGSPVAGYASGSTASLGALAASWQALECRRWLTDDPGDGYFGRQVVLAPRGEGILTSVLPLNPRCRLPGHAAWDIATLLHGPSDLTLGDVFALGRATAMNTVPTLDEALTLRPAPVEGDDLTLSVPGQSFVTALWCSRCDWTDRTVALEGHLRRDPRHCPACGAEANFSGFEMTDRLTRDAFEPDLRDRSLAEAGFRPGEVFRLSAGPTEHHFELPIPAPVPTAPNPRS